VQARLTRHCVVANHWPMKSHHAEGLHGSTLTETELQLLPLLTTHLSLREIGQLLDAPRDVVMALAQSIYAKLGPVGENASSLRLV
jgi:hypothetical protein